MSRRKSRKARKPYNKSTGRNYKRDYAKFQSSPAQRAANNKRKRDRRAAEKAGRIKKGSKQELHHVGGLSSGKTAVVSRKYNRSVKEKSRLKGSKRK